MTHVHLAGVNTSVAGKGVPQSVDTAQIPGRFVASAIGARVESDDAAPVFGDGSVASGDARVIERLYDEYGALCYRAARGIIVDEHLASDVVQDVFVAVWSGRAGAFDPSRGSVKAWLLQVTHHKAVDTVRRNQRHASRNAGPDRFSVLLASDDVDADVWDRQRRTHINAALAHLSDVQREVLSLAYFDGYTQSEISRLTGIALGTVKTRTLAALRQLRGNLDLLSIADEDWAMGGSPTAPG